MTQEFHIVFRNGNQTVMNELDMFTLLSRLNIDGHRYDIQSVTNLTMKREEEQREIQLRKKYQGL